MLGGLELVGLGAVVAFWAAIGYAGYRIAKSKGRDGALWAFLCLLLPVIGLIAIAIVPAVEKV